MRADAFDAVAQIENGSMPNLLHVMMKLVRNG
jgi:hypothetical protein